MYKTKKPEAKPLSFSTTMRNPDRIASFLKCAIPFEGQTLTNSIIIEIAASLIINKLYYTQQYEMRIPEYRDIYKDEQRFFTKEQALDIIKNSPQNHKEAGFDKGWPSRFDTWFKLPMEFGFIKYRIGEHIQISQTGHMLIDAYSEEPVNTAKIQNIMLNAMMKYQTNNPFRKNINKNSPLILLLQVLKLLKDDLGDKHTGIYRLELPLFICWNNSDALKLFKTIKDIREKYHYNYSDEFMYEICLGLLGADDKQRKRFKMAQICEESVDEYIRKMRNTGVISLRGNGRFIDINTLEQNKIDYILNNYSDFKEYSDIDSYYSYMGTIDSNVLEFKIDKNVEINNIKRRCLIKYAQQYDKEKVFEELKLISNKKDSKDMLLKFISAPTRLEFLVSIALVQQFKNIEVCPNYSIDDEGLPVFTAGGCVADIECYSKEYDGFFEVTLMCGRQEQVTNEIIPIRRHLLEYKKKKTNCFAVFIAPVIHDDTIEAALWYGQKDNVYIFPYRIMKFIEILPNIEKLSQFINLEFE